MKKTMNKPMRKLIPAVIMLLVAAMLVGTSTYAWFSMNNKVTVTGMTVTTKVSENLLIAEDTFGSTARQSDGNFKNSMTTTTISGLLEPASTVDGIDYYYTSSKNVDASGNALNDVYVLYDDTDPDAFDGEYGLTNDNSSADGLPFIDYVFQLKAINGATAAQIRLTKLALTYGGSADTGKAYRVAMFARDITSAATSSDYEITSSQLVTIFTESGATNFTTGQAVDAVDGTGAVSYCANNTTAVLAVPSNSTKYYKVVMRLWLEGEDTTCNNATYMNLTDQWSLDLEFNLVAASAAANAVQYITKTTTASKVALLTSDTVNSASDTVVINGTTYYEITGKQLNSKQLYATVTTLTTSSRVYTIEDGLYPTDVTNQVTISTPAP